MPLTPPAVDHILPYVMRRHALVAGVLVPSDGVSRVGLTPVFSRDVLLSLDTTGLRAPPTVYSDRRKLRIVVSYMISSLLAAMVRQ